MQLLALWLKPNIAVIILGVVQLKVTLPARFFNQKVPVSKLLMFGEKIGDTRSLTLFF